MAFGWSDIVNLGKDLTGIPEAEWVYNNVIKTPAKDPSQVALAQTAADAGAGLRQQSTGDYAQYQANLEKENALATALNNVINNPNAPSVARQQLSQGLDAANAQQLGAVAGATGENGALARLAASRDMAANTAAANNTGTLARATEVNNATNSLANVLNGVQSGTAGMYGTNTNAGLGYTNTALGGQQTAAAQAEQQRQDNLNFLSKLTTAFGSGAKSTATVNPQNPYNS